MERKTIYSLDNETVMVNTNTVDNTGVRSATSLFEAVGGVRITPEIISNVAGHLAAYLSENNLDMVVVEEKLSNTPALSGHDITLVDGMEFPVGDEEKVFADAKVELNDVLFTSLAITYETEILSIFTDSLDTFDSPGKLHALFDDLKANRITHKGISDRDLIRFLMRAFPRCKLLRLNEGDTFEEKVKRIGKLVSNERKVAKKNDSLLTVAKGVALKGKWEKKLRCYEAYRNGPGRLLIEIGKKKTK